MDEPKPLPCPFCGADSLMVSGDRGWHIECRACSARGPITNNPGAEAIAAWNSRAPWTVTELAAWSALGKFLADRHPDNRHPMMTIGDVVEALGGKVEG